MKLDRHWCSSLAMEGGRGEGGMKRWRREEERGWGGDEEMEEG